MDNYEDIINYDYKLMKKGGMSNYDRAHQFAPFAALTGYDDEIKETARLTDRRKTIDYQMQQILDEKINLIEKEIHKTPEIEVTYFIKDEKKVGGRYETIIGKVKRIDRVNKYIKFTNNKIIYIKDINNIIIE